MSWSDRRRLLALAATLPALAACGFRPIYGDTSRATALRGRIAVAPIDGLMGFEMRRRLTERLGATDSAAFRLAVTLDVASQGLAISEQNDISRYNLTGTASYTLTSTAGTILQSARVRAFSAYSATNSPFATQVAEEDARARLATSLADRIVTRILAADIGTAS